MYFYLGIPEPAWLEHMLVPTFVSRTRLLRKVDRLPRARAPWAMDSGGFTQITMHGGWTITPREYLREVDFFAREIGNLDWASPMDWMVEDAALKKTGKTLREHQRLTLENFIELRTINSYTTIIPVLQGQSVDDYLRHAEQYERAGFDMRKEKRVGIGSVCRRQSCGDAYEVIEAVAALGYRIHAFGLKTIGLQTSSELIVSSDSTAWSDHARKAHVLLPGHDHRPVMRKRLAKEKQIRAKFGDRVFEQYVADASVRSVLNNCKNCPVYALTWRSQMLAGLPRGVAAHPRIAQARADDVAWLARQSGNVRTPRPRGAPPPIGIEKLLRDAQYVVTINRILDDEEDVEDERGAMLRRSDYAVPDTYRLELQDATKRLLIQWRAYVVKARGSQWGELIDLALAAESGGPWPPVRSTRYHPERCSPPSLAARVLARKRWKQQPAGIGVCEPGDAGYVLSSRRGR